MRKFISLSLLFCLLILSACDKDTATPIETTTLGFAFTANYGGVPLVINEQEYDYAGKPIRFSKVSFYMSNVTLGETEVSDVNYVDLTKTHTDQAAAETGTIMNFPKIPVGEYNSMAFGIGVAPDLNRTKPSDYSTSHPLGADNSGEYWEAWESYIFVKIEGQYDADGDGFDGEDVAFAYHIGQDEMYKSISATFDSPLLLEENTPTNISFSLDIKQLLTTGTGELLPLDTHDPNNQMDVMRMIMNNFPAALIYKR